MNYARFFLVLISLVVASPIDAFKQHEAGQYQFSLVKEFKAPSKAAKRPVAWSSSGDLLFSSWGQDGSDLALFDIRGSKPWVFPADEYTINGIAYKNHGPAGVATTSIDPSGSGKSIMRLWDIASGMSQRLLQPNRNLGFGIVSLEGDAYAVLQMGKDKRMLPPAVLHYVTPYSHEQKEIPGAITMDVAPFIREKACAVGAFELQGTVNAYLYEMDGMNLMRELHSSKDNFVTFFVRSIDEAVYAFGWHVINSASNQVCYPSISRWGVNQTEATRNDLTMMTEMHNMPISFDMNSEFMAGGLENGIVFVSDVSNPGHPLCQLKNIQGNPALSIAWNPADHTQCAIGTCDGVYIYNVTRQDTYVQNTPYVIQESSRNSADAYSLTRTAQYTYDTLTTPRPLCWANETLLLTAQGKTGSQLTGIMCTSDTDSHMVPQRENATTGTLAITGIATKDTTVDGIMTTACDWFNGGKSEVRLWNRTSFASRVIYSDADYLNGGVVSGEGDRWIVVRKTESPGKGAGSLYSFAGDTLQLVAKNGAPFMVSGSRFSGERELVIGLWDFTGKTVGCFFDPQAKGIYGRLYAPDEHTWITELKVAAHSVYGFGASDSLCFFHWGYGKSMAIKYPLPFSNAAPLCFDLSEDYVVGACESLETVSQYGDTAYRSTVFVCSKKNLGTPLCQVTLNERVSAVAWNPTRKNQFAVASDKGVSLYSFSESQKERQPAQDLKQIYRQLCAY